MNTNYFLNMIAGNVFKTQTTPALPDALYIGLSSTEPQLDGTGVTEPSTSGTGYQRMSLQNILSAPTDGYITNNAAISWDESVSAWGTMTHYVVYESQTGGNLLFYGQLSSPRAIEANTILVFKANELKISVINQAAE